MSRLTELIAQAKAKDAQMGADLEREFKALSSRRAFGLNFERHKPEVVELPNRPVRKGDKVRVLPERGRNEKGDQRLWSVLKVYKSKKPKMAELCLMDSSEQESLKVQLENLVVVAEFRDFIYPGLVSTGKVEQGGDKPYHSVINGENYHVLKALTYTHRGKADVIYIDPPYNSGAKDWKYNNNYVETEDKYRHSKWLAMIERRLSLAKDLLNPRDSVLIVTIDAREYLRLGLLLEQLYPEARIQMISSIINPKGVSVEGGFRRADEYIFFVMFGDAAPARLGLSKEWSPSSIVNSEFSGAESKNKKKRKKQPAWTSMMRRGSEASREDRPSMFYPIYVDPEKKQIVEIGASPAENIDTVPKKPGLVTVLPLRQDNSQGRWQISSKELNERIKQGRVRLGRATSYGFVINYLPDGAYKEVKSESFVITGYAEDGSILAHSTEDNDTRVAPTQWKIASHNASENGSALIDRLVPKRKFPFPKSLYAVEDTIRFFITDKPNALVLDFFSGSGTTAHAIMRLNRQDGGERCSISITNNEVAENEQTSLRQENLRPGDDDWEKWGICDYITKPRIKAAITGLTPNGKQIKGDYKFVDEFPISDGFEENAEFFTLTYEAPLPVSHNLAFKRIAPLLWLRAGSQGERIDSLPQDGWQVVENYGLLVDLDTSSDFFNAVNKSKGIRTAYIVTNDDRRFQSVARKLPQVVEPVRLYESYLNNFKISSGD